MFQRSSRIKNQIECHKHLNGSKGTKKKNEKLNKEKIATVLMLSVMRNLTKTSWERNKTLHTSK